MVVLEVGSGPGYFSPRVARAIAAEGKLVVADIQQEMLDYARKRLTSRKIDNVEYYLCNGTSFSFPDACFDRIFLVTVIGEVENKDEYLSEFRRMLKAGGILSISEMAGDPDKLTMEELKELVCPYGFKAADVFGNKRNFTFHFK
jgi:ubiquinone/menaquinone biosynthesis C-methylase UbiE